MGSVRRARIAANTLAAKTSDEYAPGLTRPDASRVVYHGPTSCSVSPLKLIASHLRSEPRGPLELFLELARA